MQRIKNYVGEPFTLTGKMPKKENHEPQIKKELSYKEPEGRSDMQYAHLYIAGDKSNDILSCHVP